MSSIIKKTIKGWNLIPLYLVVLAWGGENTNPAMAEDIQYACENITPVQKEQFNIVVSKWVSAGDPDPSLGVSFPYSYCYILTEVHGTAEYDLDGSVLSFTEGSFPGIAIARVPECYDGSFATMFIPGSASDQTASTEWTGFLLRTFTSNGGIRGPDGIEIAACGAFVTAKNYPTLGDPFCSTHEDECPLTPPDPTFQTHNYRLNTYILGHHVRGLLTNLGFGGVQTILGYGASAGGLVGISLVVDLPGTPFQGTGMRGGAGGGREEFEEDVKICNQSSPTIPLSGLSPVAGFCGEDFYVNTIRFSDPNYDGLALAYDISTRPTQVQKRWEDLTASGDIQGPITIIHGTADRNVPPHLAIIFYRKIIAAGKTALARLYWIKEGSHTLGFGPPPTVVASRRNQIEALLKAIKWAQGIEPGPFIVTAKDQITTFPALNCHDLGLAEEPCKCWDVVTGTTACADQCEQLGICDSTTP